MSEDGVRRGELARFLRGRRERLQRPDVVGVPNGRRRVPGLRREEVAAEAGISTTWYTWLEQGREVNASPQVLRSLARVLRLTVSEQAYLFQLARPDLDWRNRLAAPSLPTDHLLSLLDGLAPHPAYIINRYWQVVAWNHPAVILLGAFDLEDGWSGSLIARLFLDLEWRRRFIDWPAVSRSAVAQFRLATVMMARDPVLGALLASLKAASEEFAECWNNREIAEPPVWRKSIWHPAGGEMCFDFATFQTNGRDSDFSLSVYTPVGRLTAETFKALVDATSPQPDSGAARSLPSPFAAGAIAPPL